MYTKIKFFIVSDINQSIYGFTGANPEYMKELRTFKKGRSFKDIELKNNYRSSSEIVAVSGEILGNSEMYTAKQNYPESRFEFVVCEDDWSDQIENICDKIIPYCHNLGIRREEIGILFPYNYLITQCKNALAAKNISAYISRHGFERSRIILWFEALADWCAGNSSISISNLFSEFSEKYHKKDCFINIACFQQIVTESRNYHQLKEWVLWLFKMLEILVPEQDKVNFENFISEIEGTEYDSYTISDFSRIGKPTNQIVLLTWHSAKGLEFDVVVLTGMSEDIMPRFDTVNDAERLKEEERKCFVGVSRAKRLCYLMHSNFYSNRGGRWAKLPSRYWTLIENAINNYKTKVGL